MDGRIFDALSLRLASAGTRRSALGALAAGIGSASLLSAFDDIEGKKKHKHKKRKHKKKNKNKNSSTCQLAAGDPCTSDSQCCPDKTNNLCRVPSNGGNSDTFCCGGQGAKCSRNNEGDIGDELPPFCCTGFPCNAAPGSTGTCQPSPPDD
ncbi:MAG: hypothetical protein R2853_18685 [Thermomicrobiales bacterium]|nr:hypothetical protein [Thermomicrobiales bacterium]